MAVADVKKTPGYTPNPLDTSPGPAQSPVSPLPGGQVAGAPPSAAPGSGGGGFSVPVSQDSGEGADLPQDQTDVDAIQVDAAGIAGALEGLLPSDDPLPEDTLETDESIQQDIDFLQAAIEDQQATPLPDVVDVVASPTPIDNISGSASAGASAKPEKLIDLTPETPSVLQTLAPDAYPTAPVPRSRPSRQQEEVPARAPTFIESILGFKDTIDQIHDAIPKSSPTVEPLPTPAPLELPALAPASASAGVSAAENAPKATAPEANALKQGLVDRGLPEHVAEGFVMNFQDESGLNPDINEKAPLVPGSRGGYGLYQLTGPRRKQFEAYAKERGVPTSSVDAQLDFLVHELNSTEKRAARHILNTSTSGEAAAAIVSRFLRPAVEHRIARRAKYLGRG